MCSQMRMKEAVMASLIAMDILFEVPYLVCPRIIE